MAELTQTLEDVFRREKGRVVGALVALLGNLDAAEEAFQDAVVSALASWPAAGTPQNPGAWLTLTAKNHARDAARRHRVTEQKAPLLTEDERMDPETIESVSDDELRLIFTCCHPALTAENQVALTLKVVAGFTTEEIARAFMSPETTVAQRIVRAKRTIEEKQLAYVVPDRGELPERLASVLSVVYLIFNEGHTKREAWRLSQQLCLLLPREADAFGLCALIAFSLARTATRTDAQGGLLLLSEQDRSRWDRAMIKEGLMALEHARRLSGQGAYVIQAEIAACHATAPEFEQTDWARILRCYDGLLLRNPSPVVALCMFEGPASALSAIAELEKPLARYHLFYALRADFRRRLGEDARNDFQRALDLASNDSEREFLRRQLSI